MVATTLRACVFGNRAAEKTHVNLMPCEKTDKEIQNFPDFDQAHNTLEWLFNQHG
jgi:hypothetical protein